MNKFMIFFVCLFFPQSAPFLKKNVFNAGLD